MRALSLVCRPVFRLPSFHLPASLRSTVVTRFAATTDALTPASQARGLFAQRTQPAPAGLPDYCRRISSHSVSNHQRVVRGSPGCQRVLPAVTGFVIRSQTRPLTPTESSSRRLPAWAACVTDWSFSPRCSPRRIAGTQLRFDTARFFTAQKRTSTVLSSRLLRRTSAAFTPLQRPRQRQSGLYRHLASSDIEAG